ncbi:MAG TPA: hypothetical protein VFV02_01735 [Acidimicrobiales bacterium]|jgi:hypothetical protein|nr:hypothetical protein [Acidimicrobiales bacterium]
MLPVLALLLLITIPVALALLQRVLSAILKIRQTIDDILENGVVLTGLLDGVPEILEQTVELVRQTAIGALRYGGGVDKVIDKVL